MQKPIPFSISLNGQQSSRERIDYWYYNWPAVTQLVPNYGPDSGGNKVIIHGQNFMPFKGEPDIDNANDTYVEFEGIAKVKGHFINSTKMWVEAPPNYVMDWTTVEVTLNNQQYTDDNVPYFYYKPPQVFDCDPREGPTKGGTKVIVLGNKFKEGKNITCRFGNKIVRGKFLTSTKIECISPKAEHPGYVPLTISYEGERYSSETVKYLYYETPVLDKILPTCGPVTGYTQISVFGKNFLDMGFGKVKCIFNNTIFMNATIMEQDIIKCDSPPLPASAVFPDSGAAPFYEVSITLNGKEFAGPVQKFTYYIDPPITAVTPNKGPLKGGTVSKVFGKGFQQDGVCNVTVRYGAVQQIPVNVTNTDMITTSPNATIPGSVVVSVALNGQQFIKDRTLHYRDIENTFTYYQDILVQEYGPKAGPTKGKTTVKVKGLGFQQFKNDNGTTANDPLYVRFIDYSTGE